MQSNTIYLIRHGAVDERFKGKYIGITDVHLSEKGKKQLIQTSDIFGYPYPERIYSSPLVRCTETCSIIYPNRDIKITATMSECDFGEFEGKGADELMNDPDLMESIVACQSLAGCSGAARALVNKLEAIAAKQA